MVTFKIYRCFEQVKLKCSNIEPLYDKEGGGAKKCGVDKLATAAVCVE